MMNIDETKDKVNELLISEKVIPKLSDVFKKQYNTKVYKKSVILLNKNEEKVIEKISNFITSLKKDKFIKTLKNKNILSNKLEDTLYFDKIDEYLE
jgi:hypothetical protein